MNRVCRQSLPLFRRVCYQPTKAPVRNFWGRRGCHPWSDLPAIMQEMERNSRRMAAEMERFAAARPALPSSFWRSPISWIRSPIEIDKDGNRKYMLELDVQDFNPEDVKVTLRDRVLTVYAKSEAKSKDGRNKSYQEFTQEYQLPEDVDLDKLKSVFTPEGVLQVEAPMPPIPQLKEKEIPIERKK